MKKLLVLIAFLFLSVGLKAQTHVFCPIDLNCTWTGNQTYSGSVTLTNPTSPLQLGPAGIKFNDGTTQVTAGGGSGSGIFSSFQFGSNPAITSNGNYFQLLSGTGTAFQYSGTGSISSPFLATINSINTPSGVNGLISGGYIYYTGSGYTYTVSKATYKIGGIVFSSPQSNITLAAADPTNNRIDTVFVDNTGAVGVITGVPSANPVTPTADSTTQLSIGFITVSAGTTSPSGITTTNVYLENAGPPTEWACTASSSWTCADTVKPFAGSFDISSDGSSIIGTTTLTVSPAVSLSSYNIIAFQLATNSNWIPTDNLWITFYNGSSVVGNSVVVNNNYGWDGNASSYELVVVPLSVFSLSSNNVTSIQLKWNKGGTQTSNITIHIDNIQLQQSQVIGQQNLSGITGMAGDGIVYQPTVPVVNNQLVPKLASAPAGYFLRGPIGSLGSHVAFRQSFTCISSGTTATCPITNVSSSDALVVLPMQTASGGFYFGATSDTLGTTWNQYGGSSASHRAVGFLTSSGNDTLTISGGTVASGTPFLIMELTGVSTYNDTNSAYVSANDSSVTVPFTVSNTVTPLAATDSYINVVSSNGTCYGGYQISPISSPIVTWAPAGGQSTGQAWINAPGNTSSITFSGTTTTHTGSCHNDVQMFTLDFSQSVAASSSPWIAGPITESDLPPSSISALQSVQTFTIAAAVNLPSATSTTVLSGTITMPSQGCPCRVNVQSGIFLNSTTSAQWGFWASDGTNTFGYGASITTDAHTPPVGISSMSPVSYSNNQSVTFSIIINPGTYGAGTVQALSTLSPPLPAGAKSWMTLSVIQSRN